MVTAIHYYFFFSSIVMSHELLIAALFGLSISFFSKFNHLFFNYLVTETFSICVMPRWIAIFFRLLVSNDVSELYRYDRYWKGESHSGPRSTTCFYAAEWETITAASILYFLVSPIRLVDLLLHFDSVNRTVWSFAWLYLYRCSLKLSLRQAIGIFFSFLWKKVGEERDKLKKKLRLMIAIHCLIWRQLQP